MDDITAITTRKTGEGLALVIKGATVPVTTKRARVDSKDALTDMFNFYPGLV